MIKMWMGLYPLCTIILEFEKKNDFSSNLI